MDLSFARANVRGFAGDDGSTQQRDRSVARAGATAGVNGFAGVARATARFCRLGLAAFAATMLAGGVAVATDATGSSAPAPLTIVAFGDSLTAGYGLPPGASFPAQLEAALRAKGHNVTIINAGVSGDTASAGLARFDWAVPSDADAIILELGANDALRGIDPATTRKALDGIMARTQATGLPVLIAGMEASRGLGEDYVQRFSANYTELAKAYDALLYPFFLDGVALDPSLNLKDGIHPNTEGVAIIVTRILPSVEALIQKVRDAPSEAG